MKFKYILFTAFAFSLLLSSCKDFVEGYDEDPNNASDAPIEAVLNGVFTGMIVGHEGENARLACMWSGQFTGSDRQYSSYNVYNISAEDFQWDPYYLVMENAEIVIEKAATTNNLLASGIAKILKAHAAGMVTSMWGNVPYSQATQFPEIENPAFDNQMEIYNSVQSLLDEGIADLKDSPTNATIAGADFFFNGDAAAWVAFANTLKARFYTHVKNYAAAATAAGSGIDALSGDLIAPHFTGSYNQDMNLYHSFGVLDREGYMTGFDAYLPSLLDPAAANYRGNAKTDETSRFNFIFTDAGPTWDLNYAGMWAAGADFPIGTAVENYLIKAEAEHRANNDMDAALAALNSARAVLAEMFPDGTYEAYEMADFEAGGIAARQGEGSAAALLHEILEEKYVSLVGQMEVFNDIRRTENYLDVPPVTGSAIPQRLLIPQVEIDANANTPSPIPDVFDPTPVNM